jgi:hypothetical protein
MPNTTFQKDTGLPGSALPPGQGYIMTPAGRVVVPQAGGITKEYFPTTTGGELDLRSITIPGGTIPTPGAREDVTPQGIIDQHLFSLQNQFGEQVQQLRRKGLQPAQFNQALAGMQAEYDDAKTKVSVVKLDLDTLQANIKEGLINPAAGQEAAWRMVLPPEHAAAMFPRQSAVPAERAPISPTALVAQEKEMLRFANNAPEQSGWEWGKPHRTFEDVLAQYDEWRNTFGYENYTPGQQRQLDKQWDNVMKANPYIDWRPTNSKVLARRTYGQQLPGVAAERFLGVSQPKRPAISAERQLGDIQVYKSKSPFAQSVAAQAPQATGRIKVKSPNGTVGTIPTSQQNEAISSGYKVIQ